VADAPPTILVVDDDPAVLELITFVLEPEGIAIVARRMGGRRSRRSSSRPRQGSFVWSCWTS